MVDLSTTCRTCMKKNVSLVDLFGPLKIENNCSFKLADILIATTGLEVSKEDGLPQSLCEECVGTLQNVYTFRTQAVNVEAELKKIVLFAAPVKNECIEKWKQEIELDYLDSYDFSDDVIPKNETDETSKVYKCDICLKEYSKHQRYIKHLATHESPRFICPMCNKGFHKKSSLDRHVKKHCKTENSSNFTPESIDQNLDFYEVKLESDIEVFHCPDCPLKFTKQRSLLSHKRKHMNSTPTDTPFKCDHCDKGFTLKTLLRRHIKLHLGKQPYTCTKCPKSYSRQDQLNVHMTKHNGEKPHVCPHCDKAFAQLCSLKDHVRVHTGETPYLCSECGKGFKNSSNLRQHLKRHTGDKPFPCKLCPKTFCTKGQVKSHMETHTGMHPYKCSDCSAAFTRPNSLKKHKLIHLGIKQFACDTCNMRFTCKDHLKRHKRIHTGEKPYRCSYCERSFTQSNDLVKHMRTHIGQNLYQCKFCQMKFRLIRELKRHYPIHYINGVEPDTIDDAPLLVLKGCNETMEDKVGPSTDTHITITFNSNGQGGNGIEDITINLSPDKVCN